MVQAEQDIAVSTFSAIDPNTITTYEAYTADAASETEVSLQGRLYYLRERPPSYFVNESARVRLQARRELFSFAKSLISRERFRRFFGGDRVKPRGLARPRRAGARAMACALVVVRHGYSEFNMENRFTGWEDCDLTNRGRVEGRLAGSVLRTAGVRQIDQARRRGGGSGGGKGGVKMVCRGDHVTHAAVGGGQMVLRAA